MIGFEIPADTAAVLYVLAVRDIYYEARGL